MITRRDIGNYPPVARTPGGPSACNPTKEKNSGRVLHCGLFAQHFQHCFADTRGRGRVLAGDEFAVDHDVLGHRDLGGGVLAGLVAEFLFQAEGDFLGAAGEFLFGPGVAGDVAAVEKLGAIGEGDVEQTARAVADRGNDLARVGEVGDGLFHLVIGEVEHGAVAADEVDAVELVEVHVRDRRGVVELVHELGVLVALVRAAELDHRGFQANRVDGHGAAVDAGEGDLVAGVGEDVVEVGEFAEPHAGVDTGVGVAVGTGGKSKKLHTSHYEHIAKLR